MNSDPRQQVEDYAQGVGATDALPDVVVSRQVFTHNDETARTIPNGFAAFLTGRYGSRYRVVQLFGNASTRINILEDLAMYQRIAPVDYAETEQWAKDVAQRVTNGEEIAFKFEF